MVQLSFVFQTLLLSLGPLLAAASPLQSRGMGVTQYKSSRYMSNLPQNTTHLSFDTETGELTAYDITHRVLSKHTYSPNTTSANSRRQSTVGSCAAMVNSDVQKLPGYQALLADANSLLGAHSWTDLAKSVNSPDNRYPQYPASICTDLDTDTVTVTASGPPTCSIQKESTSGVLVGTSGSVTLSSTQGTSYSVTSTVIQTSSLAVGDSFSVKVSFPGDEEQNTFSVTSTYTNSLSTATQSTDNQQSTESVTMVAGAGQTCSLQYTTTSCSVTGTGTIRAAATGWAWFEYNNGKTHWALNMDYFLTLDQRSSYISLRSGITSSTLSSYTGKCQ
ncbi:hypothetical protein MSAN_02351600 [Mycena sanguinolenta]|uniref:Uncharacterized protein n=1 Tax=Mycena sanguinolenta TaxID=230812 RepID=A0A8H6X6B6_9AGAR|nr:hypothetical protein MSAN_02351600 [Mycena sanguinolenta]